MSQTVTASFGSAKQARQAVHNLLGDHFPRERIQARGPGFSHPPPRPPLGDNERLTGQWGAGMGASILGTFGGLFGLITFGIPVEGDLIHPLLSLLGGALVGTLAGGAFGGLLGVSVPKRANPAKEWRTRPRPIVVAVEADNLEEAERAEADLLDVMGPYRPKILAGAGTADGLAHGPF